jgi:RHS repeat-associated protein
MYIKKYLIAFTFFLFSLLTFAQQETYLGDKKIGDQLLGQPTLHVIDGKFEDVKKQNVFTSINPNVSIHFGYIDDKSKTAEYSKIYSCKVKLKIIPYDNSDGILDSYKDTKQANAPAIPYPDTITLKINHNNITKGLQFDDYAVYKLPGVHKADVKVEYITYYNEAGTVISVPNASTYLELKFTTDRYYNLQLSSSQFTSVLPLEHKFIKYNAEQEEVTVANVSNGAEEIVISWQKDLIAPAVEYELEWTWIDNFGEKNDEKLSPGQISLTDQDFKLNNTRIQTKETFYKIPIVYSKGYFVYRVRPVGRFLDDISKNFYGNWTSGFAETHKLVSDWSHYLEIDQNHESGLKNWQYQSSFAEDGKKKEVVSYFDGSLRNRQTVTKINTNNKAVVGEVIYDTQGRPAIEVLPAPVESSGVHYYPDLNKNSQGTSIYTHNDFDWDNSTDKDCTPTPVKTMSNTSGASKYYSENNTVKGDHQDLVPKADLLPFSQIVYTPDNTGRIKSKGGVGKDHQIGTGHEMKYFYSTPDQKELNRLFGYKVGDASHYKKNMVIDPNGQVSVSYLDPQGRTIATALAGDKKGNLISLEDEQKADLHLRTITNLLVNNDKYASGNNNITEDGIRLNTSVTVAKKDSIIFKYGLTKTLGSYNDSCLKNKYYPFVYDWSISMTDDCANELLLSLNEAPLSSQIGTFSTSTFAPAPLDFSNKLFEGKQPKNNSYDFLDEGKYNFSKTLQVNTKALNDYADDYIAQLKNGTTCKPVIAQFETPIQETDCNVTCISCEEALVTSNLTNSLDINAYKSLLPTDQSTLGNTSGRETYITKAETKYINDNIPSTGLSTEEIRIYTSHFKAEFKALITSCRELCQQPVSLCNINKETLLADVSPNGQYGSVIGLERQTDSTAVEDGVDALSVFNDQNQLLYGGYKNTTDTDPEDASGNISLKVSKYNWRNPSGGSYKEDGEPSTVRVTKKEDGTYSPALRPLLAGETSIPTKDDPTSDDPTVELVEPQFLNSISDFLAEWRPGWAESLLPYHPEYQYYVYNKAICDKTDLNGTNSDGFDETLRNVEFYDAETKTDGETSLFTTTGRLAKLLNIQITEDPYYTSANSIDTSEGFFALRKDIMKEGLESNFDGMKFTNAQGNAISMNMLQTAYYFAKFSNGIMSPSVYQSELTATNTDLLNTINNIPDKNLKQRIWSNFKSYYIALKEKTRTVFGHVYATKKQGYNECIGSANSSESYASIFKKYTGTFARVTALIETATETILTIPSGSDGLEPVCSDETAPFYLSKEKRFMPADYGYDAGLTDEEILASAEAKADANLLLETGKCPLGLDMENFLKGLVDTNIQTNGVLVNTPAYSMPYLTKGLFNAQVNPSFDLATASPILIGKTEGNDLTIGFYNTSTASSTSSIATPITLKFVSFDPAASTYLNPCGTSVAKPTWADVVGFKNFHYISYESGTKTFKFSILATIVRKNATNTCTTPEEVIVEGYTKAAVGGCHFAGDSGIGETIALADNQCSKKGLFSAALKDLVLDLQSKNTLTTTQAITNNETFRTGNLNTYFGINTTDVVKWNYEVVSNERLFSITVNDIPRMRLNVGSSNLSIGNIKDIYIGDVKAGTKSNIVRLVTRRFIGLRYRLETRSGTIAAGKNNTLYFACCGTCSENDFDGDGYGDSCGDPNGPVTTVCQLNAQEEANYEENLKNALNEILTTRASGGGNATSNSTAINYFINNSHLNEHFQALRNYYLTADNPGGNNYTTPSQLTLFGVYYGPEMILITFSNSIDSREIVEAQIGLLIPNADQIKFINFIDIINGNSSAVRVNYTDLNNQDFTVTSGASISNKVGKSYLQLGSASSFCQFMANDYNITTPVCQNNKIEEANYEQDLKNALNQVIENNLNNGLLQNTFNNPLATKVAILVTNSKLRERILALRSHYHDTFGNPTNYSEPISCSKFSISYNSNNDNLRLIFYTENNSLQFYYDIRLPNPQSIAKFNSLDFYSDDYANINYTTADQSIFQTNGISIEPSVYLGGSTTAKGGTLCTFLNQNYGQTQTTNNKISNDDARIISSDEIFLADNSSATSLVSLKSAALATTNCKLICIPPTVAPVVCGDKWKEFDTGLRAKVPDYVFPANLNGNFFCQANYGYISTDYLAYLTKFNITTAQDPLFLSIAEFGSTELKYGNIKTPEVIDAYVSYIQSVTTTNANVNLLIKVEAEKWNVFANRYVNSNPYCSPATMVPTFSLEIPVDPNIKTPCEIYQKAINNTNIQQISDAFYNDKKEAFKKNYLEAALEGLNETLTQKATDKEYQYTLYYYDQAGNLVQTVPPQGVERLLPTADTTIDDIRKKQPDNEQNTINALKVAPNHTMKTQYRYNSLNQLVWQKTPDGGETTFAYDFLGRIIASQNEKQKDNALFSYTRYDGLGRITEAGELTTKTGIALEISDYGRLEYADKTPVKADAVDNTVNYPYNITEETKQVTKTIYDSPVKDTQNWFTSYGSDNSHKRVTAVLYFDSLTNQTPITGYANGIFYDYDVHGNVKELVHNINNNQSLKNMGAATKKVVYDYDLISGNVNRVTYQPNSTKEQFIHRYEYDADNRIKEVYTSKDNLIWEKEAKYLYYDHGPLARVEIGDKQVQGLDYIYTLQGWLKGVNSEKLDTTNDAGKDGLSVAQDAFGFALNYYKGDYQSRAGVTKDNSLFSLSKDQALDTNNLYNGNIKEMVTSLVDNNQNTIPAQFNYYKYDQLNRIKEMTSKSISPLGAVSVGYDSNYSYDRNGNLKTLYNSAPLNGVNNTTMDQLTYHYATGNNRLLRVNDVVPAGRFTNGAANDTSLDIDNQYDKTKPNDENNQNNVDYENYEYDKIGQLTKDKQEGINIDWRVDGKVKSVTKDNGTIISFEYDGLGNRIAKTVATGTKTTTTYYERDAQGNVLSTYEMIKQGNQVTYYLVEQDIYGSSRLGVEKRRTQISADVVTQLKMSARSSNLLASDTAIASLSTTEATVNTQYGLNFNTPAASTNWVEKAENSINLFDNQTQKTKEVILNAHLKIGADNVGTNLVAALHGTSKEGDSWPGDHSVAFLNSVLLTVKKEGNGYIPVVSLVKYRRDHNHYYIWKKWKKRDRFAFRSTMAISDYTIASTPIPENEWDIKARITENESPVPGNNTDYSVEITLNGNVYNAVASTREVPKNFSGYENKGMERGAGELNIVLPNNTLGATSIRYRPDNDENNTISYTGLKNEMCDFGYTVNNAQNEEDIHSNDFSLDEGPGSSIAHSTTGHEMAVGTTAFAITYCGSKDGDIDGDGKKDFEDNCPLTFNPNQEDDDGDGVGNVCDNCRLKANGKNEALVADVGNQLDSDQDGIGDACDNCKKTANFDQADNDVDENGAAKPDGIGDVCDNCRTIYNPNQEDTNNNGIGDVCEGLAQGKGTEAIVEEPTSNYRFVGDKQYELSNHLGNVLSVISDRNLYINDHFSADVRSYSDYYPFGMLVPTRHGSSDSYRYGFQGQEKDDEIKGGEGNSLNYTFRMHDPRIGRFFAVDPLAKEYPELTPYQFSSNSPIDMVELEGMEGWAINNKGEVYYQPSVVFIVFDNEATARKAASMGFKMPSQLASAEKSWQEMLARAPKVAKPQAEIRSDNLEDQVNKYRDVNPGLAVSRGVIDGVQEAPGVILPEIAFAKAAKFYKGYKAFKQSKIAANAITGGLEVVSEGNKGKGLLILAEKINPTGSTANCVLVSIEFQKKLLKRVYSIAGMTGGKGVDISKMYEYLHANFNSVTEFNSFSGGYKNLVSTLTEKLSSNSSIIIGKLKNGSGGITDHAFNAIKNSDDSWKFIDAQNGIEYTKAGMEKTFSSYKIIEVK